MPSKKLFKLAETELLSNGNYPPNSAHTSVMVNLKKHIVRPKKQPIKPFSKFVEQSFYNFKDNKKSDEMWKPVGYASDIKKGIYTYTSKEKRNK